MSKPHITSRTLWVNAVGLIVGVLIAFGVVDDVDSDLQAAIVTIILTIINLVLRLDTEHKLGSNTDDDPMQDDLSDNRKV